MSDPLLDEDDEAHEDLQEQLHNPIQPIADSGPTPTSHHCDLTSLLRDQVLSAAHGGLTNLSLAANFSTFCIKNGYVPPTFNVLNPTSHHETSSFICAWIGASCDTQNLYGKTKNVGDIRLAFTSAQKMRAAMTWTFNQFPGMAKVSWHQSEVTGNFVGNPSISDVVSKYMMAVKRRKVHAREIATSACAIEPELLRKLYHFNNSNERLFLRQYTAGSGIAKHDGGRAR
ncbi:hypothetical protein DFH07DRAFT_972230 [Mycena maculata]|uniref:Uncharacterized protein n=1 Tax=Mycena maculata TaxID=230809 RepID=A0AAD7HIJ6_9AGAR|nr:hypothetical protein DFH07DRAFT_972230 [Mycena maculata]